jgi:hypothetical protein
MSFRTNFQIFTRNSGGSLGNFSNLDSTAVETTAVGPHAFDSDVPADVIESRDIEAVVFASIAFGSDVVEALSIASMGFFSMVPARTVESTEVEASFLDA